VPEPQLAVFATAIANRWIIEGEVGRGSRATVYRARDVASGETITIARQVADALGHAHAEGALHKDVKPENIFLSGSRVLLMDLGVARAITRSMEETMTGDGLTLGSRGYMSPEHARGGVEIDARADLYGLGCVFYEMLAGEPPFTGDTPLAVLRKTVYDMPAPIATIRDSLPPIVDVALERLLAKAPSARYPDAAHLVDALSTLESRAPTERA